MAAPTDAASASISATSPKWCCSASRAKCAPSRPGVVQTNIMVHSKREHSKKPPTLYEIAAACSPGPHLEPFARERREGWFVWGDQVDTYEQDRPRHRGYDWDWATADDQLL